MTGTFRNMIALTLVGSDRRSFVPYTMIAAIHPPSSSVEGHLADVLLIGGGVMAVRELQVRLAQDVDTMIHRSQRTHVSHSQREVS